MVSSQAGRARTVRHMSTGAVARCRNDAAAPAMLPQGATLDGRAGGDVPWSRAAERPKDPVAGELPAGVPVPCTCCGMAVPLAGLIDKTRPSDDPPLRFDEDPLCMRANAVAAPGPRLWSAIAAATASLISPTDAVAFLPGRLNPAALKQYEGSTSGTPTDADAAVDRGRAARTAPAGGARAARCASSHAVMAAKGLGGIGERLSCSAAAPPSLSPCSPPSAWTAVPTGFVGSLAMASDSTSAGTAVDDERMLATGTCCKAGWPADIRTAIDAAPDASGDDGSPAVGKAPWCPPMAADSPPAPSAMTRKRGGALWSSPLGAEAAASARLRRPPRC